MCTLTYHLYVIAQYNKVLHEIVKAKDEKGGMALPEVLN